MVKMIKMERAMRVIILVSMAFSELYSLDIDIVPNSICYQEHDNLLLSCVFGDNNTIGAKFQFKPRDQPNDVYPINSTTVNHNTIEAQIPNITISKDTGTYFCSKNGYNSRRIIYIEERVILPTDLQCYRDDDNFSSIVCDWTGSNSTCWDFSIVDASMGFYENKQACNISIKCNSLSPITNCINSINGAQTKVRAECAGTFGGMMQVDFKITGRRFTSTASKIIHKTISCLSVKLRVTDVKILNISSGRSEMALSWRTSGSPEEYCDCVKQCVISTNQKSPDIVKKSCSNDTFYTLILTNFKPFTNYTSTITCTLIGSEVWSNREQITYTIPQKGGRLAGPNQEGYVLYSCQEKFYCLILYWKDFRYSFNRLKIFVSSQEAPVEFEASYSPFALIRLNKTRDCQHYDVNVHGVSSSGIATHTTPFQAMDIGCKLLNPFSCSFVNETYIELTRLNHSSKDVLVTIYWCQGTKKDGHVECENFIRWSEPILLTSTVLVYVNQTSGKSNGTSWFVGSSFSTTRYFSGIDWNACLTNNKPDVVTRGKSTAVVILVACTVPIVAIAVVVLVCQRMRPFKKRFQIIENYFRKNLVRENIPENVQNQDSIESTPIPTESYYQTIDSNDFNHPGHQPGKTSHTWSNSAKLQTDDSGYTAVEKATTCSVNKAEPIANRQDVERCSTLQTHVSALSHDSTNNLKTRLRTSSISSYCKTNAMEQFSGSDDSFTPEKPTCEHDRISSKEVLNHMGYVSNNSDCNPDSIIFSSSRLHTFPCTFNENLSKHSNLDCSPSSSYAFVGSTTNTSSIKSASSSSEVNHMSEVRDDRNEVNTTSVDWKQPETDMKEIKFDVQNNLDYISNNDDYCLTDSMNMPSIEDENYCFNCISFQNHSDMPALKTPSLKETSTSSKSLLRTNSISSYCTANELKHLSDTSEHPEMETLDSKLEEICVDVHYNEDYVSNSSSLSYKGEVSDFSVSSKDSKASFDSGNEEIIHWKESLNNIPKIQTGCARVDSVFNSSTYLPYSDLRYETDSNNEKILKFKDRDTEDNSSYDQKHSGHVSNDKCLRSEHLTECSNECVMADGPMDKCQQINEFGYLQV